MITLYHGTYLSIPEPLAKVGRKNLDFGPGFYLTKIESQAKDWAIIIATRKERETKAVLNIYNFDIERAEADNVRIKRFDTYNIEWLNYVVDCRKGKDISWEYDIVEGGVANDNVIDTVEDYEKGVITAEQALGQLRYKKVNHQICILNQEVIDKYLSHIESITL
jgi:hypothetical protein